VDELRVKYFRVDADPGYVQFDAVDGSEPVLLEALNDGAGIFKLNLKEGQFHHSGSPTGSGKFKIELESGNYFDGIVVETEPPTTPDGKNSPPEITFILQAQ
jgi:hypothetical protein